MPRRPYQPMPLAVRREPFDDPEWIFEMKYDGFRALAFVRGGGTVLVSRRGLAFRQFDDLASHLSLEVNADDAVLDGEIVKLDESGRPIFLDVIRRRGPFAFVAFDVLEVNGKDVRALELVERKHLLRALIPESSSTVLYAQHVVERGCELFRAVCERDLEGVVAKRMSGRYGVGPLTTWEKIKNPAYSQAEGRHELFQRR